MTDIKFTQDEALQLISMIGRSELLKAVTVVSERLRYQGEESQPKRNGYREIAEALGMPWMSTVDLASIKKFAEELVQRDSRQANVIREQANQIEQDGKDVKYLRASLKDIESSLGLVPGYTVAAVVEQVGIRVKSHEILRSFMKASGFTDNDGVPTMLSVLEYRKSVAAAVDVIAGESNLDSVQYIVKMTDELAHLQRKLAAVIEILCDRKWRVDKDMLDQIQEIVND